MSLSQTKKTPPPLYALYLAIFFFALHFALPLYVGSSLLADYFPPNFIGLFYAASSLALLPLFGNMPSILRRFGAWRTTLFLMFLEAGAVLALAYSREGLFIAMSFIVNQILVSLLFFNFDIFVEAFSKDEVTGAIRGVMLTVFNTAVLLGPFLAGLILTDGDYYRVYLASLALLFPAFWILLTHLNEFREPQYKKTAYLQVIRKIIFAAHPKDAVRHAFTANLLMRFFFSWMIIYTPLYLRHLGFAWSEVGKILFIALIPFVLIQYLVGWLIDRQLSEKAMLALAFVLMAVGTFTLVFLPLSLWWWAGVLFITRIGAAILEVVSDTAFFRRVKPEEINLIDFFRVSRPLAYIAGPVVGSLLLTQLSLSSLFPILAVIMLSGLYFTAHLRKV